MILTGNIRPWPLGQKIKIPISDREIGLFTDEKRIRDLFLNFPQGVYDDEMMTRRRIFDPSLMRFSVA